MIQATFLTSLTKKIENATKPAESAEAEKNQMTEMLNELDNDIEITSENIVNPGKKKKEPLGEVRLNCSSFLASFFISQSFFRF